MGLGGAPREADDYEWFRLEDLPPAPARTAGQETGRKTGQRSGRATRQRSGGTTGRAAEPTGAGRQAADVLLDDPLGRALCAWFELNPLWEDEPGTRLLLVDLDNLRAGPTRWRARMAVVVWLGRQADVVGVSGQHGAVDRARPYLAELAPRVRPVDDGSDLADLELLSIAAEVPDGEGLQVVVMSNDYIFADLADRGRLVVLSPGADALSERLDLAADDVLDLAALEGAAATL